MELLKTVNLSKTFGDFKAVTELNIKILPGEIYGILGPNGAGKSTVIKILTTLLKPSSGDAFIDGLSVTLQPDKVRNLIGYVPQMLSADGSLTGYENLLIFAKLYDIPRPKQKQSVVEALRFMELTESAHKLVKDYSGGMIRRLEIAESMMHHPKILFLDEPTIGLDPIARKNVWKHIIELKDKFNTTIVMTTHMMEEADELCNRVALMSKGLLMAEGSPEELKKSLNKPEATLEDVFIFFTGNNVKDEQVNFSETRRERDNLKRMG